MYRPEGYQEILARTMGAIAPIDARLVEAGADAILEALRKRGAYYGEVDFWRGQHHYWASTGKAGHWVFIPKEEG